MTRIAFALLLALGFLVGCDFDGPLTEKPTRVVDETLVGSWFSTRDGDSLDVYRLTDDQYLVITGNEPAVCIHSDVKGINFVSCRYIGHYEKSYGKFSYYGYKVEDGQLVLRMVKDSLKPAAGLSSAQVRTRMDEAIAKGEALDTSEERVMRFKKKR